MHTLPVPDWFANFDRDKARREAVERVRAEQTRKTRREERLKKLREDGGSAKWRAKRKVVWLEIVEGETATLSVTDAAITMQK